MIKVENIDVWGFEHAIRGMRNPMNSWDKSDSGKGCCKATHNKEFLLCKECPFDSWERNVCNPYFQIGKKDLDLMRRLYKAGAEHRKYLRQVFCSMDVNAPLYWWKEMDQYRINVTTNSCSTMHKIHAKEFTLNDFSYEHVISRNIGIDCGYSIIPIYCFDPIIRMLNRCREEYIETKDKAYWYTMIQLLPSSYNQRRTITMNYENVMTIINQRTGHKLDEWNNFVAELMDLPYVKEIRDEN